MCEFLCRPEKASAIRIVIAIAERMPELGRRFYESGPARGIARLAAYIAAQVDAGVLVVEDSEIAAAQFMEASQAMIFKSMVFNFVRGTEPAADRARRPGCGRGLSCGVPTAGQGLTESREVLVSPRRHLRLFGRRFFRPRFFRPRFTRNRIPHVGGIALPEEGIVDVQRAAVRQRQHDAADNLLLAARNRLDRLVAQRLDLKLVEDIRQCLTWRATNRIPAA